MSNEQEVNDNETQQIMKGKKILVIDDDTAMCQMLEILFTMEGAFVLTANDGREGLHKFFEERPHLVMLDIHMPHMNGWETCRQIRLLSDVPIIMLTRLNSDAEIIRGLGAGADDFISKPFNTSVLLARTRAVLRRVTKTAVPTPPTRYADGYLTIDLERREVFVQSEPVKLTATEFQLLTFLLKNAGRTLSYEQILENVWGWEYRESIDYVHVYISHLRRKLEKDARKPLYLVTVHSIGYRFDKPFPQT